MRHALVRCVNSDLRPLGCPKAKMSSLLPSTLRTCLHCTSYSQVYVDSVGSTFKIVQIYMAVPCIAPYNWTLLYLDHWCRLRSLFCRFEDLVDVDNVSHSRVVPLFQSVCFALLARNSFPLVGCGCCLPLRNDRCRSDTPSRTRRYWCCRLMMQPLFGHAQ